MEAHYTTLSIDPPTDIGSLLPSTVGPFDDSDDEDFDDVVDDDDDDFEKKTLAADQEQEAQQIPIDIDDNDDDCNDDEHTFIEMKRASLFNPGGGFTRLGMIHSKKTSKRSGSVAFTHDEVYDEDNTPKDKFLHDEDDYLDKDDFLDYANAKLAQSQLLNNNISMSCFVCFMLLAASLVVYMVFLMVEVETDEVDPVIQYIDNHTSRHHPGHAFDSPSPLSTAIPTTISPHTNRSSTWEHVFEDGSVSEMPKQQQQHQQQQQQQDKIPRLIGFIEAPPNLDELVLLVKKVNESKSSSTAIGQGSSTSSPLDDREHHQYVNDRGDTIHCGIQVDGKLVTMECAFEADLCRVYLGNKNCNT